MAPGRQPELVREEADQLLRSFLEQVPDQALIVLDRNGHVLSWNKGAETILGFRAEEIVDRHVASLYTDTEAAIGKPLRDLEVAAASGRLTESGRRRRKDGLTVFAEISISAIRDGSGTLSGFGCILSPLPPADRGSPSAEAKLRGLVDTILDTIVDGVVIINARAEIQVFNRACIRLFGYRPDEVLGRNVRILMPEPYRSVHDTFIQSYHNTGIARIIGTGREVTGQRKDGTTFPMELAVSDTSSGGDYAFIGIVRDITERREADIAREQLRQVQKMEALGQLTGGVAHDFNNLLAIIISNLDLLAETAGRNPIIHEFLDPSLAAALRGAELTQRLLAFGRKQPLQPKIVSINDLVQRFLVFARRTVEESIEITAFTAPSLWPVCIDSSQFEDALLALAVNARDAMPAGGKLMLETRNVTVDEFDAAENPDALPGDYVMVAVNDTGCGMTAEVLARACEPFFTSKEQGKGSGLGLSMVYGFVRQSGGHLKLHSPLGQGTSVQLFLPRARGEHIVTPVSSADSAAKSGARLVLVVENNPTVLKLTAAMVESFGYTVMTATTGREALDLVARTPRIDLLLTDVMLSGTINGAMLAQRAVALQPRLKVLFNSGYAEEAIFERGLLSRGVPLIPKPFRKQDLAQKISEVLEPQ